MKKAVYTLLLATLMVFMVPLSSYAAHPRAHGRGGASWGHSGWRGHSWAPHRHYRVWGPRFYWGGTIGPGPWWYPWYAYPYGYYPAPPTYVQPPPVYVQPPQPQAQENYWYYCQDPQGYYPYVKKCPGGWMKVVPQPPPAQPKQ